MPGVGIISPSKVLELPPRPDTATGTSGVYSSPARGPQCAPPGPDAGVLYRGDCRLPGGSRSGRVRGSSPVFLPLFTPRSEVVRRRFAARARGFVKGWTGWLTRGTLVLRGWTVEYRLRRVANRGRVCSRCLPRRRCIDSEQHPTRAIAVRAALAREPHYYQINQPAESLEGRPIRSLVRRRSIAERAERG